MTKLTLLAIIAILPAVVTGSAHAMAAIQEPGAYAFVYPNARLGLWIEPASAACCISQRIWCIRIGTRCYPAYAWAQVDFASATQALPLLHGGRVRFNSSNRPPWPCG